MGQASEQAPRPEAEAAEARNLGERLDSYRSFLAGLVRGGIDSRLLKFYSVDDVVQEVMLKACRALGQGGLIHPRAFRAWLEQVARNELADLVRRHFRTAKRDGNMRSIEESVGVSESGSVLQLKDMIAAHGSSPASGVILRDRAATVETVLARLPAHYREVLRMTRYEGLESQEIAQRLGKSPAAVRQLQVRAIAACRRLLMGMRLIATDEEG